jgi:general nucleoside transport system ATP-binding protein
MSVGERQRVEIVRCLLQRPKLPDHGRADLGVDAAGRAQLFRRCAGSAARAVSILYISHKLDEIRELCDTATMLRNGRVSGTRDSARGIERESGAAHGRASELEECRCCRAKPGEVRLELTRTCRCPARSLRHLACSEINLGVRGGEIVGIAGVSGNGQKELLAAISGEALGAQQRARCALCGQDAGRASPVRRRDAWGCASCPRSGSDAARCREMSRRQQRAHRRRPGLVRHGGAKARGARFARATIDRFAVKCAGELAPAESLSGGNLQKFIVGREIRCSRR